MGHRNGQIGGQEGQKIPEILNLSVYQDIQTWLDLLT